MGHSGGTIVNKAINFGSHKNGSRWRVLISPATISFSKRIYLIKIN
jgi:hypothetical protein